MMFETRVKYTLVSANERLREGLRRLPAGDFFFRSHIDTIDSSEQNRKTLEALIFCCEVPHVSPARSRSLSP